MKSKLMHIMSTFFLLCAVCLNQAGAQTNPSAPVASLKKVIWIWLENTSYSDMITQKYVNTIWSSYPAARLSQYSPVSAVTQANAFALIAGNDFGVKDNNLTRITAPTIINLLESKNIPWKVYADSFPGSCYLMAGTTDYKRYRVPFLSSSSIQSDRFLCSKIVSFKMLMDDIKYGTLPQVSFVIPGLISSGATSDPETADAELKSILDPVLTNEANLQDTTIIISTINTKDAAQPPAFTLFVGNGVKDEQITIDTSANHYNLLRTIELGLQLGHLNQNDAKADPILGFWK